MLFPAAELRAGDQVSRVFAPEDAITHLFTRELLEDGDRAHVRIERAPDVRAGLVEDAREAALRVEEGLGRGRVPRRRLEVRLLAEPGPQFLCDCRPEVDSSS